jgi:hypothetical protein
MILFGKEFIPRGSNSKYTREGGPLFDLDRLFEMLKSKCPAHVAQELKVPNNSVLYLIDKYYTEDMKLQIKWLRSRHTQIRTK